MENNIFYDESEKHERKFVKAFNDLIISDMTNSELRLFLYLKTYGQSGNKVFPSIKRISNDIGFSSATISKAQKGLIKQGYLKVEKEKVPKGYRNNYYLLDPYYKNKVDNDNNVSIKSNSDNQAIDYDKKKQDKVPYKEIINYLNEKTGKNFSHTAKGNKKLISGRFNEGNSLEVFKHVIDVKIADWLNDDAMRTYLKPETLFNSTNFEKYKNETVDEVKARREHWKAKQNKTTDRKHEDYDQDVNKRMKNRLGGN